MAISGVVLSSSFECVRLLNNVLKVVEYSLPSTTAIFLEKYF